MALDFPVGTDFPANGNQIPDGEIYEGFYWDETAGVWKRLCERDKIGDCLDDNEGETVCDRLEILQNEIIELEEEIDAIATSVGRGTWEWDFNVSSYLDARLGRGKFYMVRESDLAVVTDYQDCGRIVFHEDDMEGDTHTFDDTMVDKVLMLFDRPDDDFLESVITAVQTTSGTQGTAYIVHVDHRQSKGSPTNAPDVDGKYKVRLNIFEQPTGGDVGEYVKKIGDAMSGELNLRTEQIDGTINFSTPPLNSHHLRFSTTRTDTDSTRHAYIYQAGYSTDLIASAALRAKGSVHSGTGYYYAGTVDGDGTWTSYSPRVYFQDTYGGFYYGGTSASNRRFYLNSSGAFIYGTGSSYSAKFNSVGGELTNNGTAVAYWGRGFFALPKGLQAPSSSNSSLMSYGNSGQVLKTNGSTVYWGSVSTSSGPTDYVKDKNNKAGSQITIEYSGGNYFITGGN